MNSSDRIAVQRYAAAYNALSATNEDAARRAESLLVAAGALAGVQTYMSSPRISTEEKKQTVKAALAALPEAASFVEVLLDAKRYALLDAVVRRVEELLDERLGILRAEVVSARTLNETQQRQTEEALSARYGGEVKAIFKTNPALLGGLQIWCRGELIDGSLQGRLAKLQAELAQ